MSNLMYPEGIGKTTKTSEIPAYMIFEVYERSSPDDSLAKDTISLLMPESAIIPSSANWDNAHLGARGNAFASGGSWSDSASALSDESSQWMSDVGSKIQMLSTDAQIAKDASQVRSGRLYNPYLTMVFRGIDFRNFSFSFNFFPESEKQCDEIYRIIQTFRQAHLPKGGKHQHTLGYPDEFKIGYYWDNKPNKYLPKFKVCNLTGIDTNYTANGKWTTMRNGFPSEIILNLTFTESHIVTADDVNTTANGTSY